MQVLEKVARTMGNKYDVRIVFKGGKAKTNGSTIVLPALPEKMEEADMIVTRGYCDHEVGHVKHTDFPVMRSMIGEDKKLHKVWNVIEDLVIESKMSAEFPGAKDNMNFLANWIVGEGKINLEHPLMKLFIEGRRELCGYVIPNVPSFRKDLESLFGFDLFDRLAKIETTSQAVMLAKDLLEKYEETKDRESEPEPEKDQEENEEGQGEPGRGGGDGDFEDEDDEADVDPFADDEKSGGSGEEEKEDGGEIEGSEGEDEGSEDEDGDERPESGKGSGEDSESEDESEEDELDGEGDASSDGSDEKSGEADREGSSDGLGDDFDDFDMDSEPLPSDGEDRDGYATEGRKSSHLPEIDENEDPYAAIKEYLEERHTSVMENTDEYLVWSKERDVLEPMSEAKTLSGYERLKEKLGSLNVLRGRVQTLFLARTQSRWLNDREQGKINSRAMAKLKTGNPRVFREKFVSKDRDTAISFLVDYSGSMRGDPLESAMTAVVCFLEALEGTQIKSEVLTFTTRGIAYNWEEFAEDPNRYEYGRVEALDMKIIKGFDEPYGARTKRRIGAWRAQNNANNCDGDSVQIAYDRLAARPEERKILFVLTDGLVGNHGNVERGMAYLKRVCRNIQKAGVELIGIGLNVHGLKEYYPHHINLRNASDLSIHLFNELRKILKV
jgi:cobalamin biosynthesis protein CobT